MKLLNYKITPVNREQRRACELEVKKVLPVLLKIEQSFVEKLFDAEDSTPYNVLFAKHLDLWNKQIDLFIQQKTLKFIFVDRTYFSINYKPLENGVCAG